MKLKSGWCALVLALSCMGIGFAQTRTPNADSQVLQWDFERSNVSPWAVQDFSGGSSPKITVDSSAKAPLAGRRSAHVSIVGDHNPADAEVWQLGFSTEVAVTSGRYYSGEVTLRASKEVVLEVFVQQAREPYATFGVQKIDVGVTPTTVRFGGTANFSTERDSPASTGRLVFALGKAEGGTELWFDNISFFQKPEPAETAMVTVDFAQTMNVPSLSGFLLGLDVEHVADGNPPAEMVVPLRPTFWRVRSEWAERVAGYGAKPIVLCSEGWYPPAAPPWSDDFAAWKKHVTTLAERHRDTVVYDIWNEPDMGMFFLDWPDADLQKFLETFKVAHDAIRSVVPGATISGPSLAASYCPRRLRQFMDFCLHGGLKVDVLSLHMLDREDAEFDAMKADIAQVRADFIKNPAYGAVGVKEIHVNEYGANGPQSYRPGSILAFLRSMEEAGVVAACRACWDHPNAPGVNSGFDGSLDGLLTSDGFRPRAVWWAYKWYAALGDHRVKTDSNNPDLVVLASRKSHDGHPEILLASTGSRGEARSIREVSIVFKNLLAIPAMVPTPGALLAKIERLNFVDSGTDAVIEVPSELVPVSRSGAMARLTIRGMPTYGAIRITLLTQDTQATPTKADPDLP